jgi:hypothetical protein
VAEGVVFSSQLNKFIGCGEDEVVDASLGMALERRHVLDHHEFIGDMPGFLSLDYHSALGLTAFGL